MSVILCDRVEDYKERVQRYAEMLKLEAHKIGGHDLDEEEFYRSGLFRSAIEQIRGEFSATMRPKREFIRHILNYLQDQGYIVDWESSGDDNRHDYLVRFTANRVSAIELKGCLDGNNTTIFQRPKQAREFIIWSVCMNPGSNPRHNVWSGIHTRLSAEIITNGVQVDGVVVWDMLCDTAARPCPKVENAPERIMPIAQYLLPPPCIYVFPATTPHPRSNPRPVAQNLEDVAILEALHRCFEGRDEEVNYVDFEVEHRGADTVRRTIVRRDRKIVRESQFTTIRRA